MKQISAQDQTPTESSLSSQNIFSVKYKVPTSVLLEQIDAAASPNGITSIPSGIRNILQRAIGALARCAAWYEAVKKDAFNLDRGGHRHFIGILQSALSKLDPATIVGKNRSRAIAAANNTKKSPPQNPGVANLA
jgi:hypothetical protein